MATMSNKPLEIITVGGSLAGLMASIALRRLGHNVTIFERSPTPLLHDQGAGIVAGGETQSFMSSFDKTKRPVAVTSQQRLYLNKGGGVIHRESTTQRMTSWDLLYYLCRANFDQVQSEYLENRNVPPPTDGEGQGKYEFGRLVKGVEQANGRVKVSFENLRDDDSSKEGSAVADFVVLADGPSSKTRRQLNESATGRSYVGYVAFRGTVSESELSPAATDVFVEKFPFFHGEGTQILAYTIPGPAGSLSKGHRLVNWVWYVNASADSQEYRDIMTDKDGNFHQFTLPTGGKMQETVWEAQKTRAKQTLPPQYHELIQKTSNPFVQAITDVEPPKDEKSLVLGGKAVLIGDALSGFRPHTAASTSQAAFHALLLHKVFSGEISWETYEDEAIHFAKSWQRQGVMLGNRSQFGEHPMQD